VGVGGGGWEEWKALSDGGGCSGRGSAERERDAKERARRNRMLGEFEEEEVR